MNIHSAFFLYRSRQQCSALHLRGGTALFVPVAAEPLLASYAVAHGYVAGSTSDQFQQGGGRTAAALARTFGSGLVYFN